jgi:hypothetical protein
MALHAATVEILVEKAKFEPTVALGVAEAIELAMTQAQFVTVPILDARLHVLEAKLDASIQANKADMQRLGADLEAKMDARFAQMNAQIDAKFAQIDVKLAQTEAKLVRWVFLVMLGNVALSLAATTVLNAFKTL